MRWINHQLNLFQYFKTMKSFSANILSASAVLLALVFSSPAAAVIASEKDNVTAFTSAPYFCEILAGGADRENDTSDPAYSVALADATLVADKSFKEGLDSLRMMCSASEITPIPAVAQQVDTKP